MPAKIRGKLKHGDTLSDHFLPEPSFKEAFVCKRGENNEAYTNVPHLVTHHSPAGFHFGYPGSGPSDLALNILEATLKAMGHKGKRIKCWDGRCYAAAFQLHQDFKFEFVTPMDREGGRIEYATVVEWINQRLPTLEEWYAL